ncbi:hypothetical protein ACFVUN_05980 [Kitasatospora griseola]|uniref:hypothetical protein n=1 Tax=Kitasatospora griseola TaxID=2064 RepID=UPI0036DCEB70
MAGHHTPRTDHHADGTGCPPTHEHTSRNKPLTDGCPDRTYSKAVRTRGWTIPSPGKGYVDEERRRHLRHRPPLTPDIAPAPVDGFCSEVPEPAAEGQRPERAKPESPGRGRKRTRLPQPDCDIRS